jgi:hypothetical protein
MRFANGWFGAGEVSVIAVQLVNAEQFFCFVSIVVDRLDFLFYLVFRFLVVARAAIWPI